MNKILNEQFFDPKIMIIMMDNQVWQAERKQDITIDDSNLSKYGTHIMSYKGIQYIVSKIADDGITKDDNRYLLLSKQDVMNFRDLINIFNCEEFKIHANIFSEELKNYSQNQKDKTFKFVTDNDLLGDEKSKSKNLNLVNYLIWEINNLSTLVKKISSKKYNINKMSDYKNIYTTMLLKKYNIQISDKNIIYKIKNIIKKLIGFIVIFVKKNCHINKIHSNNVEDALIKEVDCCNYSMKRGYKTPNGHNINFGQVESVGMARGNVRISISFGLG